MLTSLRNIFVNGNKYKEHSEAIIISCFFNPQNSPYRIKAFNKFYESIKHMNHLILECVIGNSQPQLPENKNIQRIYTENLLWHKESLLNLAVTKLDPKYKYVFWIDADVIFSNKNWLVNSVKEFKSGAKIVQPFEFCVHLEKDEVKPNFDIKQEKLMWGKKIRNANMWRSFCANYVDDVKAYESKNYDTHGHVGFAWGATREVLEECPLYDRALIGGADHIIAHAAAGQIPHSCIKNSFTEDLDAVNKWSSNFYHAVMGQIAYAKGDLYHIWHGDITKREYLKRIQDFTPTTKKITEKDKNGLYVTKTGDDKYVKTYFQNREVTNDDSFLQSMAIGYMTDNPVLGGLLGKNMMGGFVGASMNNHKHSETHDANENNKSKGEHNENFS